MSDQTPPEGTVRDAETVVVDRGGLNPVYVAAGVALGLLALLALWFLVVSPLIAGDTEDEPLAAPTSPTPDPEGTPVAPEATPDPDVTEEELDEAPIATVDVFLARDPFRPVRPPEATPGAPGAPAPTGDDADGTAPPPDEEDTAAPPPDDAEDTEDEDRTTVDGRDVELIDVFTENGVERAVVRVDATSYEVEEGDVFAENFAVLRIDPPCVTLQHGDEVFRLCEGERVLK